MAISGDRVPVRGVALPSEHGGWSLTLEPVVLGLIVSPSGAGVALGCAALFGFLLRTPLKLVFVDRLRGRNLRRTVLATRVAVGYLGLLAVALGLAAVSRTSSFWAPLLFAVPLFAVEFSYDVRSKSRRLVPELMGAIGIGSVAAAIVLADGGPTAVAYGMWLVVAARAVATVPFVRLQLRRSKNHDVQVSRSDGAQLLAVLVVAGGWIGVGVPSAAVAAIVGLAVFHAVCVRRSVPPIAMIGAQQVVLGLTIVLLTGLAAIAP